MSINGYTIRQARELRGFTQEFVAKNLNLSTPSYITREKNPGRFRVDELFRFLDLVQLHKSDLFFLRDDYAKASSGSGEDIRKCEVSEP